MLPKVLTVLIAIVLLHNVILFAVENPEVKLDYDLLIPSAEAPVPCVIICSGQGFHKDKPLLKELSLLAEKSGFAAVRFNWSYFTAGTSPSEDGSKELEDIEIIINLIKQTPGIDSTRIYLAGKSMGSLLAWYAFQQHKELKGCILLTPILSNAAEGNSYYPDLATESRPVSFILGDSDALCKLQELYKYAGTCIQDIPINVLPGGHGIQIEGADDKPLAATINGEAIKLAVECAVNRLKVMEFDSR